MMKTLYTLSSIYLGEQPTGMSASLSTFVCLLRFPILLLSAQTFSSLNTDLADRGSVNKSPCRSDASRGQL